MIHWVDSLVISIIYRYIKRKKVLGYVKVSLFFSIFFSVDHLLFVFVILFTIISDMSRSATITAFHIVDFIQFVFFFSFLSFFLSLFYVDYFFLSLFFSFNLIYPFFHLVLKN